ncbi:hypothetical protein VTN31DRAFT_1803 [Thermomyces dupontii]|uniref:uncharacterized protein n=1 Tax=Talaromyces thermophilus TaxID=28565 RepID=UPI003741E8CE
MSTFPVFRSRLKYYADKAAVSSEPGLTSAQLFLTNKDLRPVDAARRRWGSWNFVAFWIADSANIVCFERRCPA